MRRANELFFLQCTLVVAYGFILFYIVLMIRSCKAASLKEVVPWARRWYVDTVQAVISSCQIHRWWTTPTDAVESRTRDVFQGRRRNRSVALLKICLHPVIAVLVWFSVNSATGGVWAEGYNTSVRPQDMMHYLLFALPLLLLSAASSSRVMCWHLDTLHILTHARMAWRTSVEGDPFQFLITAQQTMAARLSVSLLFGNMPLTVMLNVITGSLTIWRYMEVAEESDMDLNKHLGDDHLWRFAVGQIFAVAVICVATYCSESRSYAEVKGSVLIASSRQAILTSILQAVCDAHVQLSMSYRILADSPGLRALLLTCKRDVQGSSFLDCLDDPQAFVEELVRGQVRDDTVSSFRATLRDATNTKVHAQLFCMSLRDIDGEPYHMLGIREMSREDGKMDGFVAAADEERTVGVVELVTAFVQKHITEVSLCLRASNLNIVSSTESFVTLCGRREVSGPVDFSTWVADPGQFQSFVKTFVAELKSGTATEYRDIGTIVLRPPLPAKAQISYTARCTLYYEEEDQEEFSEEDPGGGRSKAEALVVGAMLSEITPQRLEGPAPSFGLDFGRRRSSNKSRHRSRRSYQEAMLHQIQLVEQVDSGQMNPHGFSGQSGNIPSCVPGRSSSCEDVAPSIIGLGIRSGGAKAGAPAEPPASQSICSL